MRRFFTWTLGTRLLVSMLALVFLSAGSAILLTSLLGRGISQNALEQTLRQSQSIQSRYVAQRFEQLTLIARIFSSDTDVLSYLQESIDSGSALSILDLLGEYQADLGFDFAIVLDADGFVVTRTDDQAATGADLGDLPLVELAFDEGRASGFWEEDGALYTAVAVPITQQFDLVGTLITGYRIDDNLVREISEAGTGEIAYLSSDGAQVSVVASSLDQSSEIYLVQRLREQGGWLEAANRGREVEIELDGEQWLALVAPLRDVYEEPIGATVSLASVRRESAGYRRLLGLLLMIGGASIGLATALSIVLGRRLLQPVRALVGAVEAARGGDYDVQVTRSGDDEVGRLGRAFSSLLTELREKRDMETFVGSLARSLPDPSVETPHKIEPTFESMAIACVELRRYARRANLEMAPEAASRFERDLGRVRSVVASCGGEMISSGSQRLLIGWRGDQAVVDAYDGAIELRNLLGQTESAFDEPEPPAVALTFGSVLRSSAGSGSGLTVAGLPIQQLDGLLREATEGDIVLSKGFKQQLESAAVPQVQDLREQRGLMSTQPVYLAPETLGGAGAETIAGDQTMPLLGSIDDSGGSTAGASALDASRPRGRRRTHYAQIEPGNVLGDRYEIDSVLGAGGMGVVYKARDRELGDLVALKMLKGSFAPGAEELEALKNELRLARQITHPNVVRTYDIGEVDGMWFLSMEYVRGLTLRYLLAQSDRIPYTAAIRLVRQVVAGLAAAHEQGILHLDIKPENIVIEANGNAKLMDFGISRRLARGGEQATKGQIAGTPHYLAPEQIEGNEPTERSDLYACGVVMYQVFTEKLPFSGSSVMEVLRNQVSEDMAAPRELWSQIPPALDQLILRCLERQPEDRFASADDLLEALSSDELM